MFFNLFKRSTSEFRPWEARMIHLLTIACGSIVVASLIYYFYRLTPSVIGLILCFDFVVAWVTAPTCKRCEEKLVKLTAYEMMWMLGSVLSSLVILSVLWISRSEGAIASPWEMVPVIIFAIYALCVFCTVQSLRSVQVKWSILIAIFFGLATFGVSFIIYRLGFGYDPFVHQATERHILEHGFILPKQPMYIGQYVSVVALSWISQLSIHRVDRVLVPMLSALVMIPMLITAFRYGWMKRVGRPALVVLALCFIPTGYFAFTVPFNLALIGLVLIVAFLPLADQPRIKWLIGALGCASLTIHPLIGLPTAMIAGVAMFRKIPAWSIIPAIPVSLFAAFTIYLKTQGASLALPTLDRVTTMLAALFGNPYELGLGEPYLAICYAFLYLAPLMLIGIAIYGFAEVVSKEIEEKSSIQILLYAFIGIVLSAMMIPLFFEFPNIIANEQFEFSLRLLLISPLLWLPGIAYAIHAALNQKTAIRIAIASVMMAAVLTGAWYVAYPQVNAIANAPAPGLSRGDIDAVQFIEANAKGMPYVALTSQMMGAGALMELGFEKTVQTRNGNLYAYAIPTGGELYQYYLRFISSDEDPQVIQSEFNQFVDAPLTYLSIPDAWDPQNEIGKRLESITMSQYEIGGNRIFKLKAVAR